MKKSEARKEGRQPEVVLNIPVQESSTDEQQQQQQQQQPYPALAPVVFRCLEQTTQLRRWCLQMAHSPWLEYLSILMVLFSCVILCMNKPYEEQPTYLKILDSVVFGFLIVEMVIKMLALGVVGYFGNNWNTLDFLINFGEVLDFFLARFSLRLKVFQAFRPMRMFGRIQILRVLIIVLIDTLPMLGHVLLIEILVILIFSVVGIQLWAGHLHNRCFLGEDIPTTYNVSLRPYFISSWSRYSFICSADNEDGMQRCSHVPPYSVDGQICTLDAPRHHHTSAPNDPSGCINWNQYYNVCRAEGNNPQKGVLCFDNIGCAWITTFQVFTLDGWTEIMFYVMDAHSVWNFLFFIFATIVGAFIMMNVCSIVTATNFSEGMKRKTEEPQVGAVSTAGLFHKLIGHVLRIFCRENRNTSRDSPESSHGRSNALGQVLTPCQRILKRTVESTLFDQLIMLAVGLSTVSLVIEHHEQPKMLTRVLKTSNIVFTIIFLVEMILKLLALKREYFKNQKNIFDFFIIIVSFLEDIGETEGKLSLVLRSMRLLRFVKLLHFLPHLKRQLLVLKKTFEEANGLCILLLSFILIFSILGMLLFGGKFRFETKHGDMRNARKNFDSLRWAMVTVFEVFTGDALSQVLYHAIAATSSWAMLYFAVLIVLGKLVLLNVLVGIVILTFQNMSKPTDGSPESDPTPIDDSNRDNGHPSTGSGSEQSRSSVTDPTPALPDITEDNESLNLIQRIVRWCKKHEDWSFFVFSPQNRFRMLCQRVITHSIFEHVVLLFIFLSCVTIAMQRPGINPRSTERFILRISFYVFSSVFLVEMLFKVLALGLFFGKDSYCRSPWNILDGFLLILSVVHISMIQMDKANILSILKVFRLLRTLHPLRMLKRAPKLRLAVEALITAIKPMGNIVLICSMMFFFFGALGVQLLKGGFHHCVGQDIKHITTKSECLAADYRWTRKTFNFDNMPQAMLSLFVMYTKNGWVDIMYDGLDAVGVDKQPVKNYNEWMLLYFISFMVISFFLLDMFIGVMVGIFQECQQQQRMADGLLLSERGEEVQCRESEQIPYFANYSRLRRWIHTLCTNFFLDMVVMATIFFSVVVMAVEHYNQPEYIESVTEYFFYVFTAVFIIEVLLKLVAFGVLRFMKDRWNLLDIAVVLISVISIIFNLLKMDDKIPINPSILRICRVLRLAQVLNAKNIRVLLKTIIKTLSQVGNICLLFMFFFFIYAALGVELFGKLECTEDFRCLGLHRYANFRNFGTALLALYRVCTGDNWSLILKDTLRECPPGRHGCPSYLHWVAPIYFISFVIMAQFVLINLVVAAISQALEDSKQEEDNARNLVLAEENVGPDQSQPDR
ncbi:voltage-dependent T-type calcium channel subunit alpha-1H-like isoform X2 [Notolabrus celidotus]|uniref:voltage-dependent T-type calcium channel subunit alpha-1H-like isoform X2 n=1 Tax=Notolabrus celidotus TaxID=1203425 RepID=UPI00148FD5F2|nr:voltage-dependent T-type calcium channel subunit alpha-1H-like isoform X2 [Notolabrus celidotus]